MTVMGDYLLTVLYTTVICIGCFSEQDFIMPICCDFRAMPGGSRCLFVKLIGLVTSDDSCLTNFTL